MVDKPINVVKPVAEAAFAPAEQRGPADGAPALPLFRFRLRHLFSFFTVVSVLLAAMVAFNGLTALALLLTVLVLAAHVAGTALGSRLRAHADQRCAWEMAQPVAGRSHVRGQQRAKRSAVVRGLPRSSWHGRGGIALPWLPRLILAGIVLGGMAGALVLIAAAGQRLSPAGILVGAISMAVLGGWFAFLGGSFYGIFRHGFREAVAEQRKDQSRRSMPR